jgi:hypothetical protein
LHFQHIIDIILVYLTGVKKMKRIKSGITCPLCKKDTIKLCRDSITVFNIKKLKTGKLKLGTESKEESQTLDNCWIECGNCHSTNDNHAELQEIYDLLF